MHGANLEHPALESAHAVTECIKRAPKMSASDIVVVNISGRGDKDMGIMVRELHLASKVASKAKANAD